MLRDREVSERGDKEMSEGEEGNKREKGKKLRAVNCEGGREGRRERGRERGKERGREGD